MAIEIVEDSNQIVSFQLKVRSYLRYYLTTDISEILSRNLIDLLTKNSYWAQAFYKIIILMYTYSTTIQNMGQTNG